MNVAGMVRARAAAAAFAIAALSLTACDAERRSGRIVIDTVAGMPTVLNPERGLVDRVEWKLLEQLRVGAGDS